MKCPGCQKESLYPRQLEMGLQAYPCKECEGVWLSAADYWKWLESRADAPPETASIETPLPVEVEGRARICPESGHLLRRYKVWPDTPFYLDRCGHCMSVWFDRGEWEAVQSRGLDDQVHMFFSDVWQRKLKAEESRRRLEQIYRERFGEENYTRIKEIRAWLDQHPQRGSLVAYLSDPDPYRPTSG